MSDYTHTRLETPDGTVVMYLAPNAKYQPVYKNDLHSQARPRGSAPISRDKRMWSTEFTLQGELVDSDDLPPAHEADLVALDDSWSAPVTAVQQKNRLTYFLLDVGGPFYLYDGADEYTAEDESEIDRANGIFPTVQVEEYRPPRDAGLARLNYTVKFREGVER
jgi:hypothetical protein